MRKGFGPEGNLEKNKTLGREASLQVLGRKKTELTQRKERHWITEEEYRFESQARRRRVGDTDPARLI